MSVARCLLVAGSYEHQVIGARLSIAEDGSAAFTPVFGYAAHDGCVKCLAVSTDGVLVSGATDENLKVYDVNHVVEVGTLQEHVGVLTGLRFYGDSHVLSGSSSGAVVIWRRRDFARLAAMSGHKGAVNDLSVHPSGKVALSVGHDRTLHLWNLLKGRKAYVRKLADEARFVRFTPSGDAYATATQTSVSVFATADNVERGSVAMPAPRRVMELAWLDDSRLAIACSDGYVLITQPADDGAVITAWQAHPVRVRGVVLALAATVLITAASDGSIRAWAASPDAITAARGKALPMLAEINVHARVTCLAVRDEVTALLDDDNTSDVSDA